MKKSIGLCLLLAGSLLFTGCAFSFFEKDPRKVITYSLYVDDDGVAYTLETIQKFEELNPDIKVEVIFAKTDNQMIKADVMQARQTALEGGMETGLSLYDLRKNMSIVDLSAYTSLELFLLSKDEVLGVPVSWDTNIMLYNKDIYDAYGLDLPRTWQELFEAAEVMRQDGVYPLYSDYNRISALLIAREERISGKSAFDAEGNYLFTEEENAEITAFFNRLMEEKVLAPIDSDYLKMLENKELAGCVTSLVSHKDESRVIKKAAGTSKIGPLLVEERGQALSGTMEPSYFYCVAADAENLIEAEKLLNYLANSKENALIEKCAKGIPASDYAERALSAGGYIDKEAYPVVMMLDYYMSGMIIDRVGEMGDYVDGTK